MDFVHEKIDSGSFSYFFRQNVVEICEKCILQYPEDQDFSCFLLELSELDFLRYENHISDEQRNIFKKVLANNWKAFMILNQLSNNLQ